MSEDNLEHQQWEPVIWSKPTSVLQREQRAKGIPVLRKQNIAGTAQMRKLDSAGLDDDETPLKHATVTLEFKMSLQKARMAKKMSQADLAKAINQPAKVVNEYESGKAIPNQAIVNKMNKVLGVHLSLSKSKR